MRLSRQPSAPETQPSATQVPFLQFRTASEPKFQTSTASLGSRSVNQAVPKSVLPTSEPQAPVPISASQKTNSQAPQKFKPGHSNRKPNRQALLKLNLPPSSELGRAFLGRAQHPNRNQNAKFQGSQLAARQRSQQKKRQAASPAFSAFKEKLFYIMVSSVQVEVESEVPSESVPPTVMPAK